jgi:hypothetical protein
MNDQVINAPQGLVIDTQSCFGALPQVCQKDIGVYDQALEYLPALWMIHVETDPLFVPVAELKQEPLPARQGEADAAHFFPRPHGVTGCVFDFDNLRSQIAQNGSGTWARMEGAQFQDSDPLQGHGTRRTFFFIG